MHRSSAKRIFPPRRRGARSFAAGAAAQQPRESAVAEGGHPVLAQRDRLPRLECRGAQAQLHPQSVEQRGECDGRRAEFEGRRGTGLRQLPQQSFQEVSVLAVGAVVHSAYLRRMRHHAPEHQPYIEECRIDEFRPERRPEESAQTLARRPRSRVGLALERLLKRSRQRLVRYGHQPRFAGKVMVDEADGNARRGADAAHRHAFMTILLEAAQGGLDQRFAAHRRGLAMKFGARPLRCHAIAF